MGKKELDVLASRLLPLGFSEYQARTYIGLLALSEAKASEVVDIVQVPKARIYQVLDELLEMGLVRKKPGRPVRYVSLATERGLENYLAWKKEGWDNEFVSLKAVKDKVLIELNEITGIKTRPTKRGFMDIINAGEISEVETKKAYRAAKEEILVLTGVFEYLPRVLSDIKKAVQRGVMIKVLFLDPSSLSPSSRMVQKEVISIVKDLEGVDFQFSKTMPMRCTIVDNNVALFAVDEGMSLPFQKEIGITDNANMINALRIYFESLWGVPRNRRSSPKPKDSRRH